MCVLAENLVLVTRVGFKPAPKWSISFYKLVVFQTKLQRGAEWKPDWYKTLVRLVEARTPVKLFELLSLFGIQGFVRRDDAARL